jgi:hypothetical protein
MAKKKRKLVVFGMSGRSPLCTQRQNFFSAVSRRCW